MKRRTNPLLKSATPGESSSIFGFTFRSRHSPTNYLKKINSILKENTDHVNKQSQQTRKGHPKREQPKGKAKIDTQTSLPSINASTIPNSKEEKAKLGQLMNQNIFLLNELMVQRYKEEDYLQTIRQLEESRQQLSYSRSHPKYLKMKKLSQSIQSLSSELTQLIERSYIEETTKRRQNESGLIESLQSFQPLKQYVSEELL